MGTHLTVVDDCEEFRYLLSLLLEEELGITCLGMSSLAAVKSHAGNVLASRIVLIDINLGPGQPDGVAVYEWLRAQDYRGQVFFLTGHAQSSPFVARAAQTGVPVLEKPMTPEEILTLLRDPMAVSIRQKDADL